jgi:hypothetical protein
VTLLVSKVCKSFALQVSDRLVTYAGSRTARPFDAASNKTVVFQASNGIASLSYTGLSYLGAKTTDTWIAERLVGQAMPEMAPDTPFTMHLGKREGRWHSMGLGLQLLADGLTSQAAKDPALRSHPITVVFAGWLWYRRRRKRPRPIFGAVHSVGPEHRYSVDYSERICGDRFTAMPVPVGYLSPSERQPFLEKLKPLDAAANIAEMIGTIRMVSARAPAVGGDCMVVYISNPASTGRCVRARYVAQDPYTVLRPGSGLTRSSVAFGPWLVGDSTVVAPSLMIGGGPATFRLGQYPVLVESTPPDAPKPSDLAMLHTSQRRPRRPGAA